MRYFLEHYGEYEYATKDRRHFIACLAFHALDTAVIALVTIPFTVVLIKLCTVFGVLGW